MAWKLRKDKLKAGTPETESLASAEATLEPPSEETEQTPVFDLSGSAFHPEPADAPEEEPEVPSFLDHTPLTPAAEHSDLAEEDKSLPAESIELEPLPEAHTPIETLDEPAFLPDPLPEFDPLVAPTPDTEPEAIAVAPMSLSHEDEYRPDPGREAIARGLVTVDSETGLPKVAPFILDTPAMPNVSEPPRMHSVVIKIGKLSATHFLTKDVTTIGRPDGVVQNYPDIEIELDDGISRRHAEIRHTGAVYEIVDVGSTNGTLLNGEGLAPNEPVTLQAGDRIRVGERTELLFE